MALTDHATLQKKKARRKAEQFRRSRWTFLRYAEKLRAKHGAEVYTVVYYCGKFYTYRSTTSPSWPPSHGQLVCAIHVLR